MLYDVATKKPHRVCAHVTEAEYKRLAAASERSGHTQAVLIRMGLVRFLGELDSVRGEPGENTLYRAMLEREKQPDG